MALAVAALVLAAALLGLGAYFRDGALLGIGALIGSLAVVYLAQAVLGALIEATMGLSWLWLGLILAVLGFAVWRGYGLLMEG